MLTTKGESASVTVKVTSPVARGRACWFKRSEVFKDFMNEIPVEVIMELMVIWGDVSVAELLYRMQVVDTCKGEQTRKPARVFLNASAENGFAGRGRMVKMMKTGGLGLKFSSERPERDAPAKEGTHEGIGVAKWAEGVLLYDAATSVPTLSYRNIGYVTAVTGGMGVVLVVTPVMAHTKRPGATAAERMRVTREQEPPPKGVQLGPEEDTAVQDPEVDAGTGGSMNFCVEITTAIIIMPKNSSHPYNPRYPTQPAR